MNKLERVFQLRKVSKIKLEQQVALLSRKIQKEKETLHLMEGYYRGLSQQAQPSKLAMVIKREKEFIDKMTTAYQSQKAHVAMLLTKQKALVMQCAILTQKCEKLESKLAELAQLEKINRLNKMEAALPGLHKR